MRFDADAFAATLAPPTLVVGGRERAGRHLSAAEWIRAVELLDRARLSGSMVAWMQVAAYVFGKMFDPPRWQLWKPWPSRDLLALPPAVWQEALTTFFASSTTGSPATTTTTTTPPATRSIAPAGADTSPASSPPSAPTVGTDPGSGPPATA